MTTTTYFAARTLFVMEEDYPHAEVETALDSLVNAGTEIPREMWADEDDPELTAAEVALVREQLEQGGDAVGLGEIREALDAAGIDYDVRREQIWVGRLGLGPATTVNGSWCFGVDTITDSDQHEWFKTLAEAVEYARKFVTA